MDLVAGVARVVVVMEHTSKSGEHKILEKCTLPLTGVGVFDLLITDLAVFEVSRPGLTLIEIAPGVTTTEIARRTGTPFTVALAQNTGQV